MIKSEGITLKRILIYVVILNFIIITVFYTLNYSNKISNIKKFVSIMEQLQGQVNIVRDNYKIWNNYNPNEHGNFYSYLQEYGFTNANSNSNLYKTDFEKIIKDLNENKTISDWNTNVDSIITNYFYFSPSDLNKYFQIETKNYIIINFYTGNIIAKDGIYDINNKKEIHRQYDCSFGNKLIINQIYNDKTEAKIEVIENRGLSQKVKIYIDSNNQNYLPDILDVFYYTTSDDKLKSCSYLNDYKYVQSERAVYFTVSTSNKYSFVVEDSNFIQYKKIDYEFNLCNPPILRDDMTGVYWNDENKEIFIDNIYSPNWYNYSAEQMKFANAKTDDGNYWVWIPRYSYKVNQNDVDIEFVDNLSSLSTSKKSLTGYKIQEAFEENGEITGFWVAKFQANVDKNHINLMPGKTLTFNKMDGNIRKELMTNNQKEAILFFSKMNSFEISNDNVHYAGGSPEPMGFIENERYSSTNNKYGVYDLICPENELTAESSLDEEGRFRLVIK